MSKQKTISIPSISGEFVTLVELSILAKTDYIGLFHWQSQTQFLPFFLLEGRKYRRFKVRESLILVAAFKKLREQRLRQRDFLSEIKDIISESETYKQLSELAHAHAAEMTAKKKLEFIN